jgi:DNA-binding SARP family transcriptional activator/Tfp pilus assembly protein PilF
VASSPQPDADQASSGVSAPDQVRVLGPVEVVGPHGPARLEGARQRSVIGLLALSPGVTVPRWRLIDGLWGERPPRTAVKSLHSHVARVRQALEACGLAGALVTAEPGYRLDIDPGRVDAARFEADVRRGREALAGGAAADAAAALRDALARWRAEVALADAEPCGWAAAEVERLAHVRLAACEALWEAELRLGHHAAAIEELERLLVAHPLREKLVELLMLALYRAGRPTDALAAYQRLRVRLADELGVDPGPPLVALHSRILRADPHLDASPGPEAGANQGTVGPATPSEDPARDRSPAGGPISAPAQLPAPVGYFTGRDQPLSILDQLLADRSARARIALVTGLAGIGKTSLAVHWAHRVADKFPDGQLFVDLRGHEPRSALAPERALAHALRSLGVPSDRVPVDPDEQASLYRSLLHGRRVLVLLDNAGSTETVLPLVPAGGGNLLLVTSRSRLPALTTHHEVTVIGLDPLAHLEAFSLLGKVLGPQRLAAEPEAADELVRLCDRMPLALRIAAAKLATQPDQPLQELAAGLAAEDRLEALSVDGGARSVRAVFASAYRTLSEPAARVFRRLGTHPGASFTADLAAAVAGLTPAAAGQALTELAAHHLVVDTGPGRFRCHDLTALYARGCAEAEESAATRAEVAERLVEWYVAVAHAANRVVDPGRDRVTPVLRFPAPPVPFGRDHRAALAYLDGERPNLLPVVRFAHDLGHHTAACHLAYLLTGFYDSRGHGEERIEMCRLAVAAAGRAGDPALEGLMRSGLGMAYNATRRYQEALTVLGEALPLMRAAGDRRGEGHVLNNMAAAYTGLRRFDAAVTAFTQALSVHSASGNRLGVALAHYNLGHVQVRLRRAEVGLTHYREALALAPQIDSPRIEAAILAGLGEAYLLLGDHPQALAQYQRALDMRRRIGDRRVEPDTLCDLGTAYLQGGDYPAAVAHFQQAVAVSAATGDANAEAVARGKLGLAYLARGDLVAAREELRHALSLRLRVPDPYEEAHLHRGLADLSERAGDPAGGQRHRERAAALFRAANAPEEAAELAVRHASGGAPSPIVTTARPVPIDPTDVAEMVVRNHSSGSGTPSSTTCSGTSSATSPAGTVTRTPDSGR